MTNFDDLTILITIAVMIAIAMTMWKTWKNRKRTTETDSKEYGG